MGQIKNIKLHIVTDIKIKMIVKRLIRCHCGISYHKTDRDDNHKGASNNFVYKSSFRPRKISKASENPKVSGKTAIKSKEFGLVSKAGHCLNYVNSFRPVGLIPPIKSPSSMNTATSDTSSKKKREQMIRYTKPDFSNTSNRDALLLWSMRVVQLAESYRMAECIVARAPWTLCNIR